MIERTREHPAVARLLAGDAVEHELPFTWFVEVDGEAGVLHGSMDLVSRVDGALEILDFKTHGIAAGQETAAAAAYDVQRDLYAAALAGIAAAPAAFSFFFPATRGEVRVPLDAAAVAAARERVVALLRDACRLPGATTPAVGSVALL